MSEPHKSDKRMQNGLLSKSHYLWYILLLVILAAIVVVFLHALKICVQHSWTEGILLFAVFGLSSFLVWQLATRHFFPSRIPKSLIFLIPLIMVVAAVVMPFIFPSSADLAQQLTVIFGLVSVAGLTVSTTVLYRLRESFQGELELMSYAINLIQSARSQLTFVVLTPNLGFARAVLHQRWHLIDDFSNTLLPKLSELIAVAKKDKESKSGIRVRLAVLGKESHDGFVWNKVPQLEKFSRSASDKRGTYATESMKLYESLSEIVSDGLKLENPQVFRYCEWNASALSEDFLEPGKKFPPLSILIADNHTVIIFYNNAIVGPRARDLRGRVIREKEEIEAFDCLIDSYLDDYAECKPPFTGEQTACPDGLSQEKTGSADEDKADRSDGGEK